MRQSDYRQHHSTEPDITLLRLPSLYWDSHHSTETAITLLRLPSLYWDYHHSIEAAITLLKLHHSTETATTIVHNNIVRAIDAGEVYLLVLLDLSAAFDTVDHGILIKVLQNRFGVQDRALNWFKSYLSDRTQSFCVESTMSNPVSLTCSVPQGSVVGPQKFVAYTEDIVETIEAFMINHHLYADDTQLQNHMHREAIQANCRKMEQCVSATKDWCSSRRLQLNADNTKVTWFGCRANIKKLSQMDTKLHLGLIVVEPVTSVRNLGVYMDGELNMPVHIGKISSACFYHLRRFRQLRNIMSSATMQRLVSAFVLSFELLQLSPSRFTCCYSKTVAESYERGSSSDRRTWLERPPHTSNARSALAADCLSNKIQTLHPNACHSEQQQSGTHHRDPCS